MKISLNWLRNYVEFDLSIDDLVHRLTMVGLEVESVEQLKPAFSGVIAGDVIKKEKHPNADKLSVCQVNTGSEILNIVCGAPNVEAGQRVPVAITGAELKDGFKIQKVKLRGIESHGMICSERELALSDSHKGIMVLDPAKFELGADIAKLLVPEDTVVEINITPNRPDCLSHIGVARELAAITGNNLKKPDITIIESDADINDLISVQIDAEAACPRYCGRLVQHVHIGPSPDWMQKRLEAVGIRSINNIVDITNYVLMETGQPLHAFDFDRLQTKNIIIRKAKENETFTTLDDKERILKEHDLLICDGNEAIALAGIMGGANSEVSDETRNIFLESAYFDPISTRKTAKRLGLSTEASQRFERGVDPENTIYAANRACQLFRQYAGGEIAANVIDVYPEKIQKNRVALRLSRIPKVLGIPIEKNKVVDMLRSIELDVQDSDPVIVTVPTNRPDLTREIDIIEEVVRLYGYDSIPPKQQTSFVLQSDTDKELLFVEELRDVMTGLGFHEIWTSSFTSAKHIKILSPNENALEIKNPLSPDTAFMRTTLTTGILEAVKWNHNRGNKNLQLFEIGKQFVANDGTLPNESLILMAAVSGNFWNAMHWRENSRLMDFYDLKGFVEAVLMRLHITQYQWIKEPVYLLDSKSSLTLSIDNDKTGWIGQISNTIHNSFDLDENIFLFQLDVKKLGKHIPERITYKPIPRFPAVNRDLAILVDEDVLAQDLLSTLKNIGGRLLIQTEVFDFYHGEQIPAGKKSIAFSLSFQSSEKTLTEDVIEPVIQSIISALRSNFHAELRSS